MKKNFRLAAAVFAFGMSFLTLGSVNAHATTENYIPYETHTFQYAAYASEFILPYSDSQYYSASDVSWMNDETLRYAINEIYARRGRRFNDSALQNYFNSKSWYRGFIAPSNFNENVFNQYEKANISMLTGVQNSRKSASVSSSYTYNGYGYNSTPSYTYSNADFLLPYSDSRYYSASDVAWMNADTLRLALNEIYARRGRRFNDSGLQNYFNSKAWYRGTIAPSSFNENVFNQYEKANIDLLRRLQGR